MTETAKPPLEYGTTPESCPCCGKPSHTDTTISFTFDYWKGLLFTQEERVWLSPSEADLLKIFLDVWPDLVPRTTLEKQLYGAIYSDRNSSSPRIVLVLYKLRKKLRPLGLHIQNKPGRGWLLARTDSGS